MSIAIPTRADEVDAAYLDHVLGGSHGRVVRASIERFGTGQVASTLRAHLTWSVTDDLLPKRVVIKIVASDSGSRDTSRRTANYGREIDFYRRLAAHVEVPTPRCLHATIDETSGAFILVLAEAPGTVGDQLRGCDPDQASAFARAAAGLHAPFWGDRAALTAMEWLTPDDDASRRYRADRYHEVLPGFLERYRQRLSEEVFDVACRLDRTLIGAYRHRACPPCLVHNDFRVDNMVFDRDHGPATVTVLDWQTIGVGSGPADLAYAVGSSLQPEVRRRLESELIGEYGSALEAAGVAVDHRTLVNDYRLGTVDGLVMAVIASQVVARTPRGDQLFAVMAERHVTHMLDHDVEPLLTN